MKVTTNKRKLCAPCPWLTYNCEEQFYFLKICYLSSGRAVNSPNLFGIGSIGGVLEIARQQYPHRWEFHHPLRGGEPWQPRRGECEPADDDEPGDGGPDPGAGGPAGRPPQEEAALQEAAAEESRHQGCSMLSLCSATLTIMQRIYISKRTDRTPLRLPNVCPPNLSPGLLCHTVGQLEYTAKSRERLGGQMFKRHRGVLSVLTLIYIIIQKRQHHYQ